MRSSDYFLLMFCKLDVQLSPPISESESSNSLALKFSKLISKIADFSQNAVVNLSCWGEALLNQNLLKMIDCILSYSGLSVLIELSQLNLSDEKLQKISEIVKNSPERTNGKEKIYWIVSVDACNQDSYQKIHGNSSNFEETCQSILKLSSLFENSVYRCSD